MLPFTVEQFYGVFREYNTTLWPAQIVLLVLAVVAVALSFRLLLKGKGFFSLATNVANGSEVESTINDWLASQPSIRVSQVQQSVSGVSGIGDQFLYVTVWYEQTD